MVGTISKADSSSALCPSSASSRSSSTGTHSVFIVDHLRKTKCTLRGSGLIKSQSICAGVAAVAHPDRVVPAPGGHRPDVRGAGAAHTLSTGPAVVLGHGWSERLGALVTLGDLLVWNPVVGPGHLLHKTLIGGGGGTKGKYKSKVFIGDHRWLLLDHKQTIKLHIICTQAGVNHSGGRASLMFMVRFPH